MSSATWRGVFTYNKYSQIAAHALRQSLKEEPRLATEKHGITALRYQHWENGKGGEQVHLKPEDNNSQVKKSTSV